MALPAPNLDDRRFQDLVDEARRLVQQRCPEWTDHNVSDPGITLIEAFAYMVDQLIYRVNRVTDLHHIRFLDLIGVRLFPPTAARCELTFRLSAARDHPVTVPAGTQVAGRAEHESEPVVFTTEEDLTMVPCELRKVATGTGRSPAADRTGELDECEGVDCFSAVPRPGDAVYFGLSAAVPGCVVLFRLACEAGAGADPRHPPVEWQYWNGEGWHGCEVDRDTTGGFTADGDVVVLVPDDHAMSVHAEQRAGWIRCRLTAPRAGRPSYTATPRIVSARACTIGGTVGASHTDFVDGEVLGTAEGVPGQRIAVRRPPIVASADRLVVDVDGQQWTEVPSFADSRPDDRHITVDRATGEIVFGPAVRLRDGSLRHYGAVPERGALVKVPRYRTGGGRRGNVARGVLCVQRDPVPFVGSVTNRRPAAGGVDPEPVANAIARAPLFLRTRDRAVTAEDYELLAREAAPQAARIRCVPVAREGGTAGDAVRVLVVPHVEGATMSFERLTPPDEMLARISAYLDERRCIGARVLVQPPYYQGVTVVAVLRPRRDTVPETLRAQALAALYAYIHPVTGGQDGTGWPFGRAVQSGEVHALLQRLPGVDLVDKVLLFEADPVTGHRGAPAQQVLLEPDALPFSYDHQIRVED
ncbi:putative baseplate assembly protein [Nonomuraea sp. NPDC047897]|uniref:putative baseplate assembly protein n=1 Tax=Nonomuraea sp. NPDC047897 TaxID=3364346 RepID=UPI0037176A1A